MHYYQHLAAFAFVLIASLYLLTMRGLLGLLLPAPKPKAAQGISALGSCAGQPFLFFVLLQPGRDLSVQIMIIFCLFSAYIFWLFSVIS